MNSRLVLSLCFTLLLFNGNSAHAQWSTIKGKFTVVGVVPALPPLPCAGAAGGPCCANPVPDQTVVVSAKNELADVFVYARSKVEKIHPAFKQNLKPLELTNVGCLFVPHAAILWTAQDLELVNNDPTGHNMNFTSQTQGFNELVAANTKLVKKDFKLNESVPKPIACNIHTWMKANLLIRDNPYFAVAAADGTFEIKNVPNDAEIEYQLWHEKTGYLGNLMFAGGVVDAKGRFKLTAANDMDLGDLKVNANVLK